MLNEKMGQKEKFFFVQFIKFIIKKKIYKLKAYRQSAAAVYASATKWTSGHIHNAIGAGDMATGADALERCIFFFLI